MSQLDRLRSAPRVAGLRFAPLRAMVTSLETLVVRRWDAPRAVAAARHLWCAAAWCAVVTLLVTLVVRLAAIVAAMVICRALPLAAGRVGWSG